MEEARKYVEPMEPQASEGDWLQLACNKHYFTDTCLGKSFLEEVIEGAHIPRHTPTSPGTASDGSGLEIVSPQKVLSKKQFPCTIEGIGELRTAWIGHEGV